MNAAFDALAGRGQRLSDENVAPLTPTELENLIECWRAVLVHETDRDRKVEAQARMRQLIALRSPERVCEMEVAKGLR